MKKKGVAVLVMVAIGVAVVLGLVFKTGEKESGEGEIVNQQAGWQEFSQQNHKFSLRYPEGWLFVPEIERADLFTGVFEKEEESQEKVKNEITGEMFTAVYDISVRVEVNSDNLSAKEHELKRYIPEGRADIAAGLEDITIAGVEGFRDTGPSTPPSSGDWTGIKLAPGNGKVYSFVYHAAAHKETHEKYLDEFYKILETLKFDD